MSADSASGEDGSDSAAATAQPRVEIGLRELRARWSRNLVALGYLVGAIASLAGNYVGPQERLIHRYANPTELLKTAWYDAALFAALSGGIAVLLGLVGWAFTARRPWQFGIRRLMLATALFALPLAPACGFLKDIHDVAFDSQTASLEMTFFHYRGDSMLVVRHMAPLVAIGVAVGLLAAVAGLLLVLGAGFRRVRRWATPRRGMTSR